MCRWAAARPRAARAASFARRVGSKPGQAPPPPTGTAAGPSGALHTSGAWLLVCGWVRRLEACSGPVAARGRRSQAVRRPPHQWGLVAGVWLGASSRSLFWSRRRPRAPQPGPPSLRYPPHLLRCVAGVWLGGVGSKPGQALLPPIHFARNSPAACSNIELASLELQCFWGVSKNDHDKLRAKFGRRRCRCRPWAPQPGPASPRGHRRGLAC